QAEDGIRYFHVTGVQTCALPICEAPVRIAGSASDCIPFSVMNVKSRGRSGNALMSGIVIPFTSQDGEENLYVNLGDAGFKQERQIGRASCRDRVEIQCAAYIYEK